MNVNLLKNDLNNNVSNITSNNSTNSNSNNNINNEKSHYFIGSVIEDKKIINKLKKIIKKLRKKYSLKESHTNKGNFITNLIYLGYFDYETAKLYMEDILKFLLTAVTQKFCELECKFNNYYINNDKSFFNISLQLANENQFFEKKIIPFLQSKGVENITGKKIIYRKPTINLIYFKDSPIIKSRKFRINLDLPDDILKIDNMCLVKGTPVKLRSGNPSLHDQMILEPINEYKYKFTGKMGTIKNSADLLGLKTNNKLNVNNKLKNNTVKNNNNIKNNNNDKNKNNELKTNNVKVNNVKLNNVKVNNVKVNDVKNNKKDKNNNSDNNVKNNSKKNNGFFTSLFGDTTSKDNTTKNTTKNTTVKNNEKKNTNSSPRSFF